MQIKIDSEFRDLCPLLSADELKLLEDSLREEGCRDPLVVWQEESTLIDGHNRKAICERLGIAFIIKKISLPDRRSAFNWIIRNQLGRRNLTKDQWLYLLGLRYNAEKKTKAEAGAKGGSSKDQIDTCLPESTAAALAVEYGVSEATVKRAGSVAREVDSDVDLKQAIMSGEKARIRKVKEKKVKDKREKRRRETAASAPSKDKRILVGDFREIAGKIPDESISIIFTDPPYDREASKMLPALADFAADKLEDGGSLILYVGQTQIPAAIDALRNRMRYWWTICCLHAGRKTVMREYGINACWKAMLWFVKGTRADKEVMVNDVVSGGEEKGTHEWQQAQSEAEYWIDKLCPKDGTVCDPFLGGGTTAVAAEKLNRKWFGIEINPGTAAEAERRIKQ